MKLELILIAALMGCAYTPYYYGETKEEDREFKISIGYENFQCKPRLKHYYGIRCKYVF